MADHDRPDDAGGSATAGARGETLSSGRRHTEGGAPTDKAHQDAGDGTLTGSIPAGLTPDELLKIASEDQTVESGTG